MCKNEQSKVGSVLIKCKDPNRPWEDLHPKLMKPSMWCAKYCFVKEMLLTCL